MPTKKQIQPGETVPLKLTATERKLVLEDLMCLDEEYEQIIRETTSGKPVMTTTLKTNLVKPQCMCPTLTKNGLSPCRKRFTT